MYTRRKFGFNESVTDEISEGRKYVRLSLSWSIGTGQNCFFLSTVKEALSIVCKAKIALEEEGKCSFKTGTYLKAAFTAGSGRDEGRILRICVLRTISRVVIRS